MTEIQYIPPHGSLTRRGLPSITGIMRDVLILLRDAKDRDDPLLPLSDVHAATITALTERDWIAEIPQRRGLPSLYKITARGLHALSVYLPLIKRSDNLCPRCKERPRFPYPTGKLSTYCKNCAALLNRKWRLSRSAYLRRRAQGGGNSCGALNQPSAPTSTAISSASSK